MDTDTETDTRLLKKRGHGHDRGRKKNSWSIQMRALLAAQEVMTIVEDGYEKHAQKKSRNSFEGRSENNAPINK